VQRSKYYLERQVQNDPELQRFEARLKQVFDYFETTKQLPVVGVDARGDYVLY
jgi:hypothetical protein